MKDKNEIKKKIYNHTIDCHFNDFSWDRYINQIR